MRPPGAIEQVYLRIGLMRARISDLSSAGRDLKQANGFVDRKE